MFISVSFPARGFRINHAMALDLTSTLLITGLSASLGYSFTCSSLFDTSTRAASISVPTANSKITFPLPSELSLVISVRP